jgi:hypothetical protein
MYIETVSRQGAVTRKKRAIETSITEGATVIKFSRHMDGSIKVKMIDKGVEITEMGWSELFDIFLRYYHGAI